MHDFAFIFIVGFCGQAPELAQFWWGRALALKPTHKAGRRGGESIARQRWCVIIKIIV